MHDGRKFSLARPGVVLAVSTVVALGASVGPATAAPSTPSSDVDAAQARVDQLTQQADKAAQRHDHVAASLSKSRHRLQALTASIARERRTITSLQSSIAAMAGAGSDQYVGGTGTSAPRPAAATDPTSSSLLTNVVVVSEDTHGLAERMNESGDALTRLSQQRALLQRSVSQQASRSLELDRAATQASSRASTASDKLQEAQAAAYEKRVGPAVAYAMSKVGDAYVYGAAGPSAFDCSGLTMAAWSRAGVSLPHSSSAQYSSGRHISESELQPGDLVFYYSPISHVGMYIGGGKIVNAENPSAGVRVTDLHAMPYVGAVRPG